MTPDYVITDSDRLESSSATYHYGMWWGCFELDGEPVADLLTKVMRPVDKPEEWKIIQRLRFYRPDVKDEKSWREGFVSGDEAEMVEAVEASIREFSKLAQRYPRGKVDPVVFDFLPLRCTGDQVGEKLMVSDRPWIQIKVIKKKGQNE